MSKYRYTHAPHTSSEMPMLMYNAVVMISRAIVSNTLLIVYIQQFRFFFNQSYVKYSGSCRNNISVIMYI